MVGHVCAVAECTSSKKRNADIIFHRFLTKNKGLSKLWATKCKRDKVNIETARICSCHFITSDYKRDIQNELLGLPVKKLLKPDAVPTIFPERNYGRSLEITGRNQRAQKKKQNEVVIGLLANDKEENDVLMAIEEDNGPTLQNIITLPPLAEIQANEIKLLQGNLRNKTHQHLRDRKKIAGLKKRIVRLENQGKRNSLELQNLTKQKILSTAQMKKLKGKKRVNWLRKDIVKAFSVRSINLKAYETARKVLKIPLPAPRTLYDWAKGFRCDVGILNEVLAILKNEISKMDALGKIAVISFDEMGLDSRYVKDSTNDSIVSHSKAQVVMVRGLFSPWKQPIYYNFDTSMTKPELFKIIDAVENCGIHVYAIVSDLGGPNVGLWKSLRVDEKNVSFSNPFDNNRKVYVLGDVPHDHKNIRNHTLDDGIILDDTKNSDIVDMTTLEAMLEKNGGELKLCPNFTRKCLQITGAERMRVRPAAQFLSHRMSALAQLTFPAAPKIGEFFETMNNGFDVLNSRIPKDSKNPLKCGFGFHKDKQLKALNKLKCLLSTMRFRTKKKRIRKKALPPCQKGYLMSIASTIQLFDDLKSKYDIPYILTCRLNQDCLESFFALIRSLSGTWSHPTPPEFRFRMRMALLGSKCRPPKGTNTSYEDDDMSYLSYQLLKMDNLSTKTSHSAEKSVEFNFPLDESIQLDTNEEDSLRYLAGYLAWKLKRTGKGIYGIPTAYSSTDNVNTKWIEMLSRGGLLAPNEIITKNVFDLEISFKGYFEAVKNETGITSLFIKLLRQKHSHINEDIICEFVKIRLKIKIKSLNEKKQQVNRNRRRRQRFNS